ncbi:MAG: 2-amino-4-hydroxy-6-hydroxymethyldihydropteridine diphosphokinase [Candidatus Altiarchaeota archaeon]
MAKVFLSLGSNLGVREKNIKEAVRLLGEKCKVMNVSPLYETEPVGYKEQGMFLNCAAEVETELTPIELLWFIKVIEQKLKRKETVKNGPRTIDIDILFYDNLIFDEPELTLPHPRLHERQFVLQPLNVLCPAFTHPVLKKTVAELYRNISVKR